MDTDVMNLEWLYDDDRSLREALSHGTREDAAELTARLREVTRAILVIEKRIGVTFVNGMHEMRREYHERDETTGNKRRRNT